MVVEMRRALPLLLLAACDGGSQPDILARLQAIPGVTATEAHPSDGDAGLRYFELHFTEPIDHADPSRGTFQEYAELIHADESAPTVLYTSGYGVGFASHRGELATGLGGNQLRVQYRYFDQDVTNPDWSDLTVEQAAADFHDIVGDMRPIEDGAWLHSGGSKGGMTALFSRYLYPDDVDGIVAYVAPIMTANPDARFATVLDNMGDATCRTNLRAAQRAIASQRTAIETSVAADGHTYAILGMDYATQVAIIELEWSFWQFGGEGQCAAIPAATADAQTLYKFLTEWSPPAGYDDDTMKNTDWPYTWQVMSQLGYPQLDYSGIADLVTVDYQDLSPQLPTGAPVPTLDSSLSDSIISWAQSTAPRVILVYGQWDPWSAGGAIDVSASNDSYKYTVAGASHISATIGNLDAASQAQIADALGRWTGATFTLPAATTARSATYSPDRSRSSGYWDPP
jgi:hypothetical protein